MVVNVAEKSKQDFGNVTTNVNNQTIMNLTAMFNSHVTDQLVRAGINYKFD